MPSRAAHNLHLDMENSTSLRTSEKQANLRAAYDSHSALVEAALAGRVSGDVEILSAKRSGQLSRLVELIGRKAEIESEIVRIVGEMEVLHGVGCGRVGAVVEGLVRDLREEMEAVSGLVVGGEGGGVSVETDDRGDGHDRDDGGM